MAREVLEALTVRTAAHQEQAAGEVQVDRLVAHQDRPVQAELEALTDQTVAHREQAEPAGRAAGQAVRGDRLVRRGARSSRSEQTGTAALAQAGVRHPVRQAQAGQDVGHPVPQGLVGRKPFRRQRGGAPRLAELGSVGLQGRGFSEERAWWPIPG